MPTDIAEIVLKKYEAAAEGIAVMMRNPCRYFDLHRPDTIDADIATCTDCGEVVVRECPCCE